MARSRRAYVKLVEIFKSKGCVLYTTKEEYEAMDNPSYQRFRFKASCTHDNDAVLDGFIFKNTGVICKDCTNQKVINTLQQYQQKLGEDINPCYEQEYRGFLFLSEILCDEFDMMMTTDGCFADIIIKPKYSDFNKWIMIQAKTTHGVYKKDGYKFGFKEKSYENAIIVCMALDDRKVWIMDYTNVLHSSGICIGLTPKSKLYDTEVPLKKLPDVMHNHYATTAKFNKEYAMIPKSSNHITEYIHRLKREKQIDYLPYTYPKLPNYKVDFYINDYKIQEKVAYPHKTGYTFCLKKGYKSVEVCYDKGDNDFYWIWIKDTDSFYLIPENKLIQKKLVQVDGNLQNKQKLVHIHQTFKAWADAYKYDISAKDTKQRLLAILQSEGRGSGEP